MHTDNFKFKYIFVLYYSLFILFISACSHEGQFIDEIEEVCFSSDVLPVLQNSCGNCHSSPIEETNFSTKDYSSVLQIVKPGNARKSELYQVITAINSRHMMPPDKPLSKEQRTLIMIWIEQGAANKVCSGDTALNPIVSDSVCFTQTIQPILVSSCATTDCHDVTTAAEGYILTTYDQIFGSEEAVVPYQPNESKIYKILSASGEERMPPEPREPLTTEQKEFIRKWIAEGALNSDCPDGSCDTINGVSFSQDVLPLIQLSCTGCHNNNSQGGGIILSDYNTVSNVAATKVNGVSRMSGVIRRLPGFSPMPPSGNLSECDIRRIEIWIENGMNNN